MYIQIFSYNIPVSVSHYTFISKDTTGCADQHLISKSNQIKNITSIICQPLTLQQRDRRCTEVTKKEILTNGKKKENPVTTNWHPKKDHVLLFCPPTA